MEKQAGPGRTYLTLYRDGRVMPDGYMIRLADAPSTRRLLLDAAQATGDEARFTDAFPGAGEVGLASTVEGVLASPDNGFEEVSIPVCAWSREGCDSPKYPHEDHGNLTHGICEPCKAASFPKAARQ